MSAHAKLSPSGSKRWMSCAGSLVLEQAYPNEDTQYSRDGTAMHEVAASCLTDGFAADTFIGEVFTVDGEAVKFTAAMAELVQGYVDLVKSLVQGDELYIEQRVDFSPFVEVDDSFGTADVAIVRAVELHVIDLKTGRTPVEVENNTQLMTYALGALHQLAVASVEVRTSAGKVAIAELRAADEEDLF